MAAIIAVHTGAGNKMDQKIYRRVIREACELASTKLNNGGSVVDACETAIATLENSKYTNAGLGSNLTYDGTVECEASIMDGRTLHFGSCTNVTNIKNPIRLARVICDNQSANLSLERIPPLILSGQGASKYAQEVGLTLVDPESLISQKALFCYNHFKNMLTAKEIQTNGEPIASLDTVGAICIDSAGNCAAGTSSGGLILKFPGRIGQSAIFGAGCWAQSINNTSVATCTTGNGEFLIKTIFAKELATDLFMCQDPTQSVHTAFKTKFLESPLVPRDKPLFAGALSAVYDCSTGSGEIIWSHTTKYFCLGFMTTQQKTPKFINSQVKGNEMIGESVVVSGAGFAF